MTSTSRPNVLVIIADQLRRDALGVYGDPNVRTPHIDALAARGVRFDAACATSPICVPFRFSLMTGEYAHTRMVPAIWWRMSPAERTLAEEFNEAGYRTMYVGKWHLDGGFGRAPGWTARAVNRTPVLRPFRGGWQVWRGFELRNDPFDTCYFRDDDPTPHPLEGYQTTALFDLAARTIAEERDPEAPFFLVLSVEPPHPPYSVPAEDEERWTNRDLELPPNFEAADATEREELLKERRLYYAAVEHLDVCVGRLVAQLEADGPGRDTVVVFLSDHGELGGSHGLREKQYPYEESVGIPLIVTDPRRPDQAGAVRDLPVCTEDLYPTLLGLAGLATRDPKQGVDLAPVVWGQGPEPARAGVQLEFVLELRPGVPFHDGGWRGFRTRRHKYTLIDERGTVRPWQLFDLIADPHERVNLVADPEHAGLRAELHAQLEASLFRTHDHFRSRSLDV